MPNDPLQATRWCHSRESEESSRRTCANRSWDTIELEDYLMPLMEVHEEKEETQLIVCQGAHGQRNRFSVRGFLSRFPHLLLLLFVPLLPLFLSLNVQWSAVSWFCCANPLEGMATTPCILGLGRQWCIEVIRRFTGILCQVTGDGGRGIDLVREERQPYDSTRRLHSQLSIMSWTPNQDFP